MKFVIFLALLIFSQSSNGDILYIDANDTKNEINIFKEYADCLGEKLIVLPKAEDREMYRKRGLAIEKKKAEKAKIEKTLGTSCHCTLKDNWSQLLCPKTLWTEIDAINAASEVTADQRAPLSQCAKLYFEWSDVFHQVNSTMPSRYHAADLRKDLIEVMSQAETEIKSVVISGHHYLSDPNYDNRFKPGAFQGLTSWLQEEELAKAFEGLPGNRKVQSLFLLGCKPLYLKESQQNWTQAFPNADFIGGYSVNGYLNSDPNGNQFIRDLLSVHEESLAKIRENLGERQLAEGLDAIMRSGISVPDSAFGICTRAKGKAMTYNFKAAHDIKKNAAASSKRPICKKPTS
jgi:hypothetical protein